MLHDDIVLVNRWAKVVNDFKLGDIVTFWCALLFSVNLAIAD